MVYLSTGRMNRRARKAHHPGWFRVFRGKRIVEVWFGDRWWLGGQ